MLGGTSGGTPDHESLVYVVVVGGRIVNVSENAHTIILWGVRLRIKHKAGFATMLSFLNSAQSLATDDKFALAPR